MKSIEKKGYPLNIYRKACFNSLGLSTHPLLLWALMLDPSCRALKWPAGLTESLVFQMPGK